MHNIYHRIYERIKRRNVDIPHANGHSIALQKLIQTKKQRSEHSFALLAICAWNSGGSPTKMDSWMVNLSIPWIHHLAPDN